MRYYLALGSNLGDRRKNLLQAVNFLNSLGEVVKISSVYESKPVEMAEVAFKFYNLVLSFNCPLPPQDLLEKIKSFEQDMGRNLEEIEKKPREIDIDILLAGEMCINNQTLSIPHQKLHKRDFVLVPLAEIAPTLLHPKLKTSIRKLAKNCKSETDLKPIALNLL